MNSQPMEGVQRGQGGEGDSEGRDHLKAPLGLALMVAGMRGQALGTSPIWHII